MTDKAVSALTSLTGANTATGDLLYIVDISEAAAADRSKKITVGDLHVSIPNGTNSAPSIAFASDPNTGIFRAGADSLGFAVGGTQAATLDASGNLVLGNTSASAKLDVNSAGTVGRFACSSADLTLALIQSSANPVIIRMTNNSNNWWDTQVNTDDSISWDYKDAEKARITSGGSFVVAAGGSDSFTTGVGIKFLSDGRMGCVVDDATTGTNSYHLYNTNATNNGYRFYVNVNGGINNYSANNVNLASDERLKKDISPLDTTWDKLKQIEVVNFRYKDCNEGDPLLYGVIAQQVQPIVPELVVVTREAQEAVEAKAAVLNEKGEVVEPAVEAKEAAPEYYGIREQPMYWLAIKALQEAMARIEQLEAKVAVLEGK